MDIMTYAFLKKKIDEGGGSGGLKREIVESLPSPSEAKTDVIYMIKDASAIGENIYNEYMFIDNRFELIGNTKTTIDVIDDENISEDKTYSSQKIEKDFMNNSKYVHISDDNDKQKGCIYVEGGVIGTVIAGASLSTDEGVFREKLVIPDIDDFDVSFNKPAINFKQYIQRVYKTDKINEISIYKQTYDKDFMNKYFYLKYGNSESGSGQIAYLDNFKYAETDEDWNKIQSIHFNEFDWDKIFIDNPIRGNLIVKETLSIVTNEIFNKETFDSVIENNLECIINETYEDGFFTSYNFGVSAFIDSPLKSKTYSLLTNATYNEDESIATLTFYHGFNVPINTDRDYFKNPKIEYNHVTPEESADDFAECLEYTFEILVEGVERQAVLPVRIGDNVIINREGAVNSAKDVTAQDDNNKTYSLIETNQAIGTIDEILSHIIGFEDAESGNY